MRIKKVKKTKNEYIYSGDVWVRNFTKIDARPILIENLLRSNDVDLVLNNERSNHTLNLNMVSDERFRFPNVVIVSDGYDFINKVECLKQIPDKQVCVIAVNKALKKWPLIGVEEARSVNFYVINNPYDEAMHFLPNRYFPACVASTRTNFDFLNNYPGLKYLYEPTPEKGFGYKKQQVYFIDDYRNPISAAMGLAYRFGARKIMLLCCDDSFDQQKPGSIQLDNGLWTYPQHLRSQQILDTQSYWLNRSEIQVANYSSGLEYKHAVYINEETDIRKFFLGEDENEGL